MASTHILGYPRIGANRELKFALEAFWRGEADEPFLRGTGRDLRAANHSRQARQLSMVTAGDFAFYDLMLDHAVLFGCAPRRFGRDAARPTLADYFAYARGDAAQPALEMTKWFDTNYHYLVPELDAQSRFDGPFDAYVEAITEAQAAGRPVKPVLIGPVTFLRLSKTHQAGFDRLSLLPALARAYARLLRRLKALGVEWVQIDEPVLCLELETQWLDAFDTAYAILTADAPHLLLATYFDSAADHAERVARLPVQGVHLDLVRAPQQLAVWLRHLPLKWVLSAGVIDGRNIWRTDLRHTLAVLRPLQEVLGERLWLATSCSLLHAPISLAHETALDPEIRDWLAFADEKIAELEVLGRAINEGEAAVHAQLEAADAALAARRRSRRVVNEVVQQRQAEVTVQMAQRASAFPARIATQHAILKLPPFPTTTIGSFPQTGEIRRLRAAYKRHEIGHLAYLEGMRGQIRLAVEKQEEYGLDVLVHGEAERNDMVEYFGEQLFGYTFTANGWVQSYGSRCVKPPIIYGDVYRPEPMTVDWTAYAQSLTAKTMKGMLTGPITMLQWSFVRDDQPRAATALQIALALRDEVTDLEKAGVRMVQIDEPALREGLPLKKRDWPAYLEWAVHAFRIAAAGVRDETQIHTHMCYAEFNDIFPAIAALDADVITIETSRSDMELLDGFGTFKYPNDIGPGVYDIHSPRIPTVEAMVRLLDKAAAVVPVERLWVNPDCGLKTRIWSEVDAALANMVEAARIVREKHFRGQAAA
ncbi:MAG TPA: 5-methyltetrahydropteroyltriglutamate--homocysteine S-methyltransferase [Burkholderiales bacterium]